MRSGWLVGDVGAQRVSVHCPANIAVRVCGVVCCWVVLGGVECGCGAWGLVWCVHGVGCVNVVVSHGVSACHVSMCFG